MARTSLSEQEYRWIIYAVDVLVGARPSKAEARRNPQALTQRWAWGSVRGWTERKLLKYDHPATLEEIYYIVRQYL